MTSRTQLLDWAQVLSREALDVLEEKSDDYAAEDDALRAFREIADQLGLSMQQVWAVFFSKHVAAVMAYARDGTLESEPLRSRIIDLKNYLDILYAMYKEDSGTD